MSTRGHRKNQYKKGAIVERHIEGSWFLAEVLEIDVDELTLRYLDDDNIEKYVHIDEIRMAENECILSDYKPEKKSTLPKPLLGLVDDDSAERSAHQPKVIRHSDIEIDKAVVINGPEKRLAVGGGMRALRYLKS